jgi:hypothetical protein
MKRLTAVLTPAHTSVAPARGNHGLDTNDEAFIDDLVIVKIIVVSRTDRLIEALGISSHSPDSDRSADAPQFDKS